MADARPPCIRLYCRLWLKRIQGQPCGSESVLTPRVICLLWTPANITARQGIEARGSMSPECPFCMANRSGKDQPVFANETCFFLKSTDEVLQHSGMIIPFRHVSSPFDLTPAEWIDTFDLLIRAKAHLDQTEPSGFNLGWNVGQAAGQAVDHVHLHVIARFADEPLTGQGIRYHLKQLKNRRQSSPDCPGSNSPPEHLPHCL